MFSLPPTTSQTDAISRNLVFKKRFPEKEKGKLRLLEKQAKMRVLNQKKKKK